MMTAREMALTDEVQRLRAALAIANSTGPRAVKITSWDAIPHDSEPWPHRVLPIAYRVIGGVTGYPPDRTQIAITLDNYQDQTKLETAIYLSPEIVLSPMAQAQAMEGLALGIIRKIAERLKPEDL